MFSNSYLRLAAAAMLVIGIGFLIRAIIPPRPETSEGIAALNKAYGDQRPVESRITEFGYAPPPPVTRGAEQEKLDYVARDRAQALIQLEAAEHPSAQSYHDLGRLYLTQREFDKAIDQFEKALAFDDKNAQLHNDYGVALLEKGKASRLKDDGDNSLEDFARALEHFNKALELDGSLLEALFNRALCHQEMSLFQKAEEDWRAYLDLDKDPTSKWAEEASQKLKDIEEQKQKRSHNWEQLFQDFIDAYKIKDDEKIRRILSQCRDSRGGFIENKLLDSHLHFATVNNRKEADRSIEALKYVGELEAQNGDRYSSALVWIYSSATDKQRARLVRARQLMELGDQGFAQSRFDEAINRYTAARQEFHQAGSSCEVIFADYRIGHCYLLRPDREKARSIFEQVLPSCEDKEYLWLVAQCFNHIANIKIGLKEYSEALTYGSKALKLSEQINDVSSMLRSLVGLGDIYRSISNPQRSLDYIQRGLYLSGSCSPDPMAVWGIYIVAAFNFNPGFPASALEYQKEALRLASGMGRPLILSRSYEYVGMSYGKLKAYDKAIENVQLAFQTGELLSGEQNGLEIMAHASLQLGEIYRESGDYSTAISAYDRSLQLYDKLDFQYYNYPASRGKLLCYIAQNDDSTTEREIQTVLNLLKEYRSKMPVEDHRNSFFDAEQSIYDLAIDFEFAKMSNPQQAFDISELCRARSLLDSMKVGAQVLEKEHGLALSFPADSDPFTFEKIKEHLPDQAQLLQYEVLDNKLLIWLVSKSGILPKDVNIASKTLNEKVVAYLKLMASASGSESTEALSYSKDLYEILIAPIESSLSKEKLLCIIPDKFLHYVPYCALVSPGSNRYLVEDYFTMFSPSSSAFIVCSEEAIKKESIRNERLLSVGNPTFDYAAFPSCDRLLDSAREAKEIAGYYAPSCPLIGDDAKKERVKSEMAKSDVIQLATHYVADPTSPLLSKLLLAKEPRGIEQRDWQPGVLQVADIYKMKLPKTRLVVLSACQTAIEKSVNGEGPIGAARPFMALGVPLVVASFWLVESKSTANLMISFHKHRKMDGLNDFSTVQSLRSAQLEMLKDSRYRQPYYWASFAVTGGYAKF